MGQEKEPGRREGLEGGHDIMAREVPLVVFGAAAVFISHLTEADQGIIGDTLGYIIDLLP